MDERVEATARAIYEAMPYDGPPGVEKPPWRPEALTAWQWLAVSYARAALAAADAVEPRIGQTALCGHGNMKANCPKCQQPDDTAELVDPLLVRLRSCHLEYVEGQPVAQGPLINPDGPEATAEIERLTQDRDDIKKRAIEFEDAWEKAEAERDRLRDALEKIANCDGSFSIYSMIVTFVEGKVTIIDPSRTRRTGRRQAMTTREKIETECNRDDGWFDAERSALILADAIDALDKCWHEHEERIAALETATPEQPEVTDNVKITNCYVLNDAMIEAGIRAFNNHDWDDPLSHLMREIHKAMHAAKP